MPFRQNKEGQHLWQAPDNSRITYFIQKLLENKKEDEIPSAIQDHLSSFLSSTLSSTKRISNSNNKRSSSISTLLKTGIHPVDIILPVYGNLQIVQECIEAVLNRTLWPFKLIIVDDQSPDPTVVPYLRNVAKSYPDKIELIANHKNKGFAGSVNRGIKASSSRYICVLNSDVIVTDGWLEKMVLALEAHPRNQIVNPVTNNTALINVPMQEGFSYLDMNKALELSSSHSYPEIMPTGFCFLFRRELTKSIGFMDEGFKKGYGEDSDFWMKTISYVKDGEYLRWRAVLADDTYIFHERSTSFTTLGNEEYQSTRQAGSSRFHQIWPNFKQWQKGFDVQRIMAPFRNALPNEYSLASDSVYNIAFVVHSTAFCGGMKFIADIVNKLIEKNVNAKVVHIKRNPKDKPQPLGELRVSPITFNSTAEFEEKFSERVFKNGIVVAASCELIPYVKEACNKPGVELRSVLLSQSDDPKLTNDKDLSEKMKEYAKEVDFLIPCSSLLEQIFAKEYGKAPLFTVKPGVDTRLFHPRDRSKGDERPTVLIPLLQSYPYKGYNRGVAVAIALNNLCEKKGKEIRVLAYGVTSVPNAPNIIGLGSVTQSNLAQLLGTEVDILCDPSTIHSYGLPALEAMASGVVPVMWDNGGINEYAKNGKNAIILPNEAHPKEVAVEIFKLIFERPEDLEKMKKEAIKVDQIRSNAVNFFIQNLEDKLNLRNKPKKIAVITPHLRKHGGPTTILQMANHLKKRGHNVRLYSVYPDINPEVIDNCQVPISVDWKNIQPCDVLITNSDNDQNEFFSSYPKAKKKVMLKLSHNPRFQYLENLGLNLPWDAIITSTDWLADICKHPTEGWDYKPREATRIGWYHYGHEIFSCLPTMRTYGSLNTVVRIGFLSHQHPLKGSQEAIQALYVLKQKYKEKLDVLAVGEWPEFANQKPDWIKYALSPTRQQLAELFKQVDIWITASHTEGLGRMALEAMSSSCAVILSDTGAEFARHEENCLVVGRKNVPQIIRNVDRLLEDQELFTTIVKNAYETACHYANPDNYISNLDKVLKNVCED